MMKIYSTTFVQYCTKVHRDYALILCTQKIYFIYCMQFGLMCEDNKWRLSMVGSINNFGQFIGIPISGVMADK